jgi:hypothetical protein
VLPISLGTAFNNQPDFFTTCAEAHADSDFHIVMAIGKPPNWTHCHETLKRQVPSAGVINA